MSAGPARRVDGPRGEDGAGTDWIDYGGRIITHEGSYSGFLALEISSRGDERYRIPVL